jgi:hypothetical protein
MNGKKADQKTAYRIRVKGVADYSLTDWLGDIKVLQKEKGETLLVGRFADQAALRGFLDQVWNLNFTLLSVQRMEDENHEDCEA